MFKSIFFALFIAAVGVQAERHIVSFNNSCGGDLRPFLVQNGRAISFGNDFVSNGPLVGAVAYLQTGSCQANGDGCTVVETTLQNPTSSSPGSSTGISLTPPRRFSGPPVGFQYTNGCDGAGAVCANPSCTTASRAPNDNHAKVACPANDVNLVITFC